MPSFSSCTMICATPQRVWDLLRDFTSVKDWHPLVKSCTLFSGETVSTEGAIREISLLEGPPMHERLDHSSDSDRQLDYSLIEAGLPIRNYRARVTVIDHIEPAKAIVIWQSSFAFSDVEVPALEALAEKVLLSALEGLQNHYAKS